MDRSGKCGQFRSQVLIRKAASLITAVQVPPAKFQLLPGFFRRKIAVGHVIATPRKSVNGFNGFALFRRQKDKGIVEIGGAGIGETLGVVAKTHGYALS